MRISLRSLLCPGLCAVACWMASPARAGGVQSWNSTVDPTLVVGPAGDIAFHVIPRRSGFALPNLSVWIDLCGASGWALDPTTQPPGLDFALGACRPRVISDAQGVATFQFRAGGTTAGATLWVLADGTPLAQRAFASPDLNGDLLVNADDEAILVSRIGTASVGADYDADGVVTEADHAILRAHLGHAAAQATAAGARSWGAIKRAAP